MENKLETINKANSIMRKYKDKKYELDCIDNYHLKKVISVKFKSTAIVKDYQNDREISLSKKNQENVANYIKSLLIEECNELKCKLEKINIDITE